MSEILCSTGALLGKPNNRNYKLLEPLSKQLLCDGYEFMMYSSWYEEVDSLIATLQALKLHIPVMHCEKHIGELISMGGKENFNESYRRFEINCRIAQNIGARKIVIHLWDGLTSDKNFDNNVKAYFHLNQIADKFGIDILIENVVCNVDNPMKHWLQLAQQYPNIHFVFDTKMAAFHAQLDLLYQSEYEWLWRDGHIKHYHVNDYAGGYKDWKNLRTLPIGTGHIDFGCFFDFIKKIDYHDTFTLEATAFNSEGVIDVEMLNRQIKLMKEYLL